MKKSIILALVFLFTLSANALTLKASKISDKFVYINIYYHQAKMNDTLLIALDEPVLLMFDKAKNKYASVLNEKGFFCFKIPVNKAHGLFTVSRMGLSAEKSYLSELMRSQIWEAGDSISISISGKETQAGLITETIVKGRGALKYNLANQLKQMKSIAPARVENLGYLPADWDGNLISLHEVATIGPTQIEKLKLIDSHKNDLSTFVYDALKVNILSPNSAGIFSQIKEFVYTGGMEKVDGPTKVRMLQKFYHLFDYLTSYSLNDDCLAYSYSYSRHLINLYRAASYLNVGHLSPDWIINAIKNSKLSQFTKECLIMSEFLNPLILPKHLTQQYTATLQFIKTPGYKEILKSLIVTAAKTKFYKYKLEDNEAKIRDLSEFNGRVVLLDFWFTNCGGCLNYYKNVLSKVKQKFKANKQLAFVSISVDKKKEEWLRSIHATPELYTSQDAVNLYTNGLGNSHPIIKDNNISAYPFIVLLDKKGNIIHLNTSQLYSEKSLSSAIQELL